MSRRHTVRRKVKIQELIDEWSIAAAQRLRTDSDAVEPVVRAVVEYLVAEYPAQEFYVPADPTPAYPEDRIVADLEANKSIRSICIRYGVGRGTVYRINERRKR